MNKFKFILKHDNGNTIITTYAKDLQSAISNICKAENCPERAVTLLTEEVE